MSDLNPYAAPSAAADAPASGRSFALSDELRAQISRTALVMLIAATLQLFSSSVKLALGALETADIVVTVIVGVIPVFVALAGLSLRRLATPGNDSAALLTGLRRLYVVFFVKGLAMLLVIVFVVLAILAIFVLGMTL